MLADSLIPFTRWISPLVPSRRRPKIPRRHTTQVYIYMMPFDDPSLQRTSRQESWEVVTKMETYFNHVPQIDVERIRARFQGVSHWLNRAEINTALLYPQQVYLLTLLEEQFFPNYKRTFRLDPEPGVSVTAVRETRKNERPPDATAQLTSRQAERNRLMQFIDQEPTAPSKSLKRQASKRKSAKIGAALQKSTKWTSWRDKTISPHLLFQQQSKDGRVVIGLDPEGKAKFELENSGHGGDGDRVILLKFIKHRPRDVEVMSKEAIFKEYADLKDKEMEKLRAVSPGRLLLKKDDDSLRRKPPKKRSK
jgi:hypothetical protein